MLKIAKKIKIIVEKYGNPWNSQKNRKDKLKFIGNGTNAVKEYLKNAKNIKNVQDIKKNHECYKNTKKAKRKQIKRLDKNFNELLPKML